MQYKREKLEQIIDMNSIENTKDVVSADRYLINNKLILNSDNANLLNELKKRLNECDKFFFSVAFINFSGLQLLLDTFKDLEDKGVKGKILTSTYLNFTEPKALKHIKNFTNIDLKIFEVLEEKGFHTKAYIFENKDDYTIIIGSSNITQRALKSNVEWNVKVVSKRGDDFTKEVIKEYESLWDETTIVDNAFIVRYEEILDKLRRLDEQKLLIYEDFQVITPNSMQRRAVASLSRLRKSGEHRALVVAAAGTGKTYMSAFDVLNVKPQKVLFLVHREEILKSAQETFRKLYKNKGISTGFLTGTQKDFKADYLFATIQTIKDHLASFKPDQFPYLILDEAHHAASPSYRKVINYFKPKFMLGMTATPERCDDGNIFDIFDNNIALEIRLREAMEEELLIPFHYFGITDINGVNLEGVNIDNINEVTKILKINERVDYIVEKMNFYGFDGVKLKAIGFCASIEHAIYMAEEFNSRGIHSTYLTGEHSVPKRVETIVKLECNTDPLEVIFTVDIFNEGVDIPSINTVLMLRPTNSPIVFIQ